MRLTAAFTAISMVVVAAGLGAMAYFLLGLSGGAAVASALALLSLLALYAALASRPRENPELSRQITDLARGAGDLARQVGDLGRRVVAMEATLARLGREARQASDPLAEEIAALGTLLQQLAESVAAHETALQAYRAPAPGAPAQSASPRPAVEAEVAPPPPPAPAPAPRHSALDASALIGELRAALNADRIDLHLQPIVTLPQRKVRHYEALVRLRTEDGTTLAAEDVGAAAVTGGLAPSLDRRAVTRAVAVARRLFGVNRESALFVGITNGMLADAALFPQLFELLSAERALASALVLQVRQDAARAMGPVEQHSLSQLAGLGFRFALDEARDLQLDPRRLNEQGFRFVKIPAAVLLDPAAAAGAHIHPSDLSNLLARHGIDLIAHRIEREGMVVDLLDHDVRYGQGALFAPPRPVRADVFQAGEAAPAAMNDAEGARTSRRRDADIGLTRAPAERSPQGLAGLARTMMRRA